MVSTIERTATVIDRLGHTAGQSILPNTEFNHLAGSVIETEPTPRARDFLLIEIFNQLQTIVGDESRANSLMLESMIRAKEAAGNGEKRRVLIKQTLDFRLSVLSDPQTDGVSVELRETQDGEETVINLSADHATAMRKNAYVDDETYEVIDPQEFADDLYLESESELHDMLTKVRKIDKVVFGKITIEGVTLNES